MEVSRPFFSLVILIFISSMGKARQTAHFFGTYNQENYTVCNETSDYDSLTLSCSNYRLVHVTSLVVGNRVNCASATVVKCNWNERESLANNCEGKHGRCSHSWSSRPSVCPTINYIQVGFQCINNFDVHDMCSYRSTPQYHRRPTYYKTPIFDEYPFAYYLNARCECRLTASVSDAIDIEVIYLDLERSASSCYDSISFEHGDQVCSSPDRFGNTKKKTFYAQTSWTFTANGKVNERGGWLKVSLRSGNGYYAACNQKLSTTTHSPTRYIWTTNSYERWTSPQVPYVDFGTMIGTIGGVVAFAVVTFIATAVIKQRRINRTQRAVAYRAPVMSHQPYPQQPDGYNATSCVGGIPSAAPTETYGPPPTYSSLQLETNLTSTAVTFPPPPATT